MLLIKNISRKIYDGKLNGVESDTFCIICKRIREDGAKISKLCKD